MRMRNSQRRNDKLIKEKRKDTYRGKNTLPAIQTCTSCGAVFMNGRWTWNEIENHAIKTMCPACRRISDNYPAGFIEIKGRFFEGHEKEIENLIRNTEKLEKNERPLERIISMKLSKGFAQLTTTGVHIARRIGEALSRSYQGNFTFKYLNGEKGIRVYWER